MTKHLSDQPRSQTGARMREFARQDRESGTHPAIEALRSRPRDRDAENHTAQEFARIERGRTV